MKTFQAASYTHDMVDPRMAAEAIASCFMHSVLKGLHKSPRITFDDGSTGGTGTLGVSDISCLVIQDGCVGLPVLAAIEQGIPIIAVRENRNCMATKLTELPFAPGKLMFAESYYEAAGIMLALRSGINPASVRRPAPRVNVVDMPQKGHWERAWIGEPGKQQRSECNGFDGFLVHYTNAESGQGST